MKIIYIELNNWIEGENFPNEEPFISWFTDYTFLSDDWYKKNKLCANAEIWDMSVNLWISAPEDWVKSNWPSILEGDNRRFITEEKTDDFPDYKPENYGLTWLDD
jgi:hypothetical protein